MRERWLLEGSNDSGSSSDSDQSSSSSSEKASASLFRVSHIILIVAYALLALLSVGCLTRHIVLVRKKHRLEHERRINERPSSTIFRPTTRHLVCCHQKS